MVSLYLIYNAYSSTSQPFV